MPRPKIIDDKKLTELFKQGKSLKEIGEALGVSHVAVHKRIKRLGLSQLPKSLENLTEKEKGFVMAVAGGQSRISAVMQTYDVTSRESAKALQKTLMRDPEIRTAIDDLMEMKGIGRDFRIQKLGEHMKSPDPVVSLKALDMGFKLSGDEQEAKRQPSQEYSFVEVDLTPYQDLHFKKRENKQGWEMCHLCNKTKVEGTEEFCEECKQRYPEVIEKVEHYWNGDKCVICGDDRRCYDFCKACKETKESV